MSYVFLIMVIYSSKDMHVVPMESAQQCQAAVEAINIAEKERSWVDMSPVVDNVKCVEVNGDR